MMSGGTFVDEAVVINVAANDRDPDGSLDLASIVIVTQPLVACVPQSDGTVQYLPDPEFVGSGLLPVPDLDDQGGRRATSRRSKRRSLPAGCRIRIDSVTSTMTDSSPRLDALLIINRPGRSTDGELRSPCCRPIVGPNFYDVNGNQQISAADALLVINELSQMNNGGGIDAEQIAPAIADGDGSLKFRFVESSIPPTVVIAGRTRLSMRR